MRRHTDSTTPRLEEIGFRVWRSAPSVMGRAHMHTDVEAHFIPRGGMRYFLAGRFQALPPRRLAVLWAGMPHRLVETDPETECCYATIPLAWFLQWGIAHAFVQRLLSGDILCEPGEEADGDQASFERWERDLADPRPELGRIALLEVEARMRRLAAATPPPPAAGEPRGCVEGGAVAGQVERIAQFVSRHYREPLSVAQIADGIGLHPVYAMQVFKQGCGMSLWEYLTRLRVSHAQRLLLTTDWKVHAVASESGFGSLGRFHETFRRVCGRTPGAYRRMQVPARRPGDR